MDAAKRRASSATGGRAAAVAAVAVVVLLGLPGCYDFNNPIDPLNSSGSSGPTWNLRYAWDFEVSVGTTSDSLPEPLPAVTAESSEAEVGEDPASGGGNALRVTDSSAIGTVTISKELSPVADGLVRVTLRLRRDGSHTGTGIRFGFHGPGGTVASRIVLKEATGTDSADLRNDPGGAGMGAFLDSLEPDRWYEIRFHLDCDAATAAVWVDGVLADDALGFTNPAASIDRLQIDTDEADAAATGTIWIDDLRILESVN